jgi:hypothetical protein
MHVLGKSPSAKLRVRAPAMARPWARVRPHRRSFPLGGDDPENRLVEESPDEGSVVGGMRCMSLLPQVIHSLGISVQ